MIINEGNSSDAINRSPAPRMNRCNVAIYSDALKGSRNVISHYFTSVESVQTTLNILCSHLSLTGSNKHTILMQNIRLYKSIYI